MYTNADMLHNKLKELETIAKKDDIDIISITETLIKNMPSNSKPEDYLFKLEGYNTVYNYHGRGLCLFIKNNIDYVQMLDYEHMFKTSIFINILNSQCKLTVGAVYRSPNTSHEENINLCKLLEDIANKNKSLNNKLIITGDFNFPGIDWVNESTNHISEDNIENKFLNCIQSNFLFQHVDQPTHSRSEQTPTLIDLVFSNDSSLVSDMSYGAPLGNSHHSVLTFTLYVNLNESPNEPPITKFNYYKGNYNEMRNMIKNCNWDDVLKPNMSVNEWKDCIEKQVINARNQFVPKITINKNSNKPKRTFKTTSSLIDKLHNKRKAFKFWKLFPTTTNVERYKHFRNIVNLEVRKAKIAKEADIAKKVKTNPKSFFSYVNSQIKTREDISNLRREDGSLTTNDQEKSEVLNNFFSSVFVSEGDDPLPDFQASFQTELTNITISDNDMLNILNKLNVSKSPGPDSIHPRLIKELSCELAHPLCLLFNKTMREGIIPDSWKDAEVKPLFKKGNKDNPGNYRPVSLTSILCKVFEQFVRDALFNHLINNKILSKEQYGFCKQRSCVSQLLVTLNEWFYWLDNRIPVDAAYLDFKKAFDSVPHKRLLYKLYSYGIRGNVLQWIKSFLSDRTQFVNVNGHTSNKTPVISGVPQGSVLGPCLFIYFINDLPDVIEALSKIFADDTKAYKPIFTRRDNDILQLSINNMVDWSDKWLLGFNSDKCKILYLGKNNPKFKYYIREGDLIKVLSETLCEKDLGIHIDPNLTFDFHISTILKTARRMSGLLIRSITQRDPPTMTALFIALVRMILEYGNVVWCPYKKKPIHELEKIQRQFTKQIKGMKNLNYSDRLSALKLPSLEYRRMRGDLIETYKVLHEIYDPLTTNSLLTKNLNSVTRTNSLKLLKNRVNFKPYSMFYTNRVINIWNRLPRDIVCANSLNIFKNKLDRRFINIMYQTNIEK